MKTICSIVLFLISLQFSNAQEISMNNINSSTVLNFYQQNEMLKEQYQGKSVDISVQIGEGNIIELFDKTPNYINLIQTGNYNTTYFVNPNSYPTNAEIHVNGSGNYIDITGSNSISDGIKININANDMTIFMRNY